VRRPAPTDAAYNTGGNAAFDAFKPMDFGYDKDPADLMQYLNNEEALFKTASEKDFFGVGLSRF